MSLRKRLRINLNNGKNKLARKLLTMSGICSKQDLIWLILMMMVSLPLLRSSVL